MRCLYLLLSNCAFLRNTTPQEKNCWTASLGGSQREVLKREDRFETTTIFFCLTICYLPMIISRMFISTFVISSVNSAYFVHFTGVFFVISNSLLNPIIHCVRMKQFRLALKELNRYSGAPNVNFRKISVRKTI